MHQRHRIATLALLAVLPAGGAPVQSGAISAERSAPSIPPAWNAPIAVALEARTVQSDVSFGMHVVRPIYHGRTSKVLLEAYGYEGESELGMVGGGAIFRQTLGRKASLEASAFFEGLRATDGFSYPQFGAGLAFSPDKWVTLRANGYLPLRGKESRSLPPKRTVTEEYGPEGRELYYYLRELRAERSPMRGFDVEAEFRLPNPPRWVDPRVAVGYAYREADGRPEVFSGITARGELHFAKHFVTEFEWRNDMNGVGQEWRVGIQYQIQFGGPARESGRVGESYLPVKRFPYPTVARGVVRGKGAGGEIESEEPEKPIPPADPDNCCPTGQAPLIFD